VNIDDRKSDANISGGKPRILIADDVPALRKLLRRMVEADGRFEIAGEAADGEQAVQLAKELQPDLVILDLMMPGKSGIEALHEIRDSSPSSKVLIFSGLSPGHVSGAVEADGFLEKGSNRDEIMAEIERLLGQP
jgi:two-component system chemotaxis response regulator CheY